MTALLFRNPAGVISDSPFDMNFDLFPDKSLGVIHAIPFDV